MNLLVVDGPNRELRSRKQQGELKFASPDRTNGECGSLIGSRIFPKPKKEREREKKKRRRKRSKKKNKKKSECKKTLVISAARPKQRVKWCWKRRSYVAVFELCTNSQA